MESRRNEERLADAIRGASVGKLSGAVGTYAMLDPALERACSSGSGGGRAGGDPGRGPRPPRPAGVHDGGGGQLARPPRHRAAAPPAHRGARGRGGVHPRAEGQLGDAPQAQPDHGRAHLGHRAGGARALGRGPRGRGPVARARHLPLLGGADHPSRRLPRPRLHARPRADARGGPRGASGANARGLESSHGLVYSPAGAAGAGGGGPLARGRLRPGPAQRPARLGRGPPAGRAARRRPRRDRASRRPRRWRRCSTPPGTPGTCPRSWRGSPPCDAGGRRLPAGPRGQGARGAAG